MITIELTGGLGNQMFQYALALKMRHIGKNVCIKPAFGNNSFRKFELDCFQGMKREPIPVAGSSVNAGRIKKILKRILRRNTPIYKDRIITYQPNVFEYDRAYLIGYWQNERYFSNIRDLIRDTYSFDEGLVNRWNEELKTKYNNSLCPEKEDSVSVHVRRTDYYSPQNMALYGDICTKNYYQKAISYFDNIVDNAIFYFFSDDLEWVRRELIPLINPDDKHDFRIIDADCKDVAFDLWMMTRCKHHIIANSTYSWWGAWLGSNEDKKVVSPSVWINGYDTDIICHDWIRM